MQVSRMSPEENHTAVTTMRCKAARPTNALAHRRLQPTCPLPAICTCVMLYEFNGLAGVITSRSYQHGCPRRVIDSSMMSSSTRKQA